MFLMVTKRVVSIADLRAYPNNPFVMSLGEEFAGEAAGQIKRGSVAKATLSTFLSENEASKLCSQAQ